MYSLCLIYDTEPLDQEMKTHDGVLFRFARKYHKRTYYHNKTKVLLDFKKKGIRA